MFTNPDSSYNPHVYPQQLKTHVIARNEAIFFIVEIAALSLAMTKDMRILGAIGGQIVQESNSQIVGTLKHRYITVGLK